MSRKSSTSNIDSSSSDKSFSNNIDLNQEGGENDQQMKEVEQLSNPDIDMDQQQQ